MKHIKSDDAQVILLGPKTVLLEYLLEQSWHLGLLQRFRFWAWVLSGPWWDADLN